MTRGELSRVLGLLAIAGIGAGVALAVAFALGGLRGTTTVEQFVAPPASQRGGTHGASGHLSIEEIYKLDAPGVVEISAATGSPGPAQARPLGSGFVIDKAGHILTNSRVIAGIRTIVVSFSENDQVKARVVGVDPATGVALLQVVAQSRALTPLPLGDSDAVQVGDLVVAIGNPLSSTRTATAGIVSAVQHSVDISASSSTVERGIETDAEINSGNAGGPLINEHGEVIGVTSPAGAGVAPGSSSLGMGFAIPIDTAEMVVAELIHSGKVVHAFLGLTAVPVTSEVARIFNLPSSHGLLVEAVVPGSSASKAGLHVGSTAVVVAGESYRLGGDIIVEANGRSVWSVAQLRDVVSSLAPGATLRLKVWRAGAERTLVVTLGGTPG